MATGTSVAEAVRRWVDDAPPDSVLDVREAPTGPSNATRVALSRMSGDPDSPVSFVRRHIYWKAAYTPNPVRGPYDFPPDLLAVALHLAGDGVGLAGYLAAKKFGWTRQVLICPEIAMLGRPPRGFEDDVVIHSRRNEARQQLSFDEATLLEAVIGYVTSYGFDNEYKEGHSHYCAYEEDPHSEEECLWEWPDALDAARRVFEARPRLRKQLNPARLTQVAAGERTGGQEMRQHLSDVADVLADTKRAAA